MMGDNGIWYVLGAIALFLIWRRQNAQSFGTVAGAGAGGAPPGNPLVAGAPPVGTAGAGAPGESSFQKVEGVATSTGVTALKALGVPSPLANLIGAEHGKLRTKVLEPAAKDVAKAAVAVGHFVAPVAKAVVRAPVAVAKDATKAVAFVVGRTARGVGSAAGATERATASVARTAGGAVVTGARDVGKAAASVGKSIGHAFASIF